MEQRQFSLEIFRSLVPCLVVHTRCPINIGWYYVMCVLCLNHLFKYFICISRFQVPWTWGNVHLIVLYIPTEPSKFSFNYNSFNIKTTVHIVRAGRALEYSGPELKLWNWLDPGWESLASLSLCPPIKKWNASLHRFAVNINEETMTNRGPVEWAFFKWELSLASRWENAWTGLGSLELPSWSSGPEVLLEGLTRFVSWRRREDGSAHGSMARDWVFQVMHVNGWPHGAEHLE